VVRNCVRLGTSEVLSGDFAVAAGCGLLSREGFCRCGRALKGFGL
jgi:hypothetical protein